MYFYVSIYSKPWFSLIFLILIQYHSIHSSFLPFHICNSFFPQWESWLLLLLIDFLNSSIPQYVTSFPTPCQLLPFWLCFESFTLVSDLDGDRVSYSEMGHTWAFSLNSQLQLHSEYIICPQYYFDNDRTLLVKRKFCMFVLCWILLTFCYFMSGRSPLFLT